jgi:outer membrane protein TolC
MQQTTQRVVRYRAAGTAIRLALAAGLAGFAPLAWSEPLTLDQAVTRARAANPSLRAARLDALAAGARTTQAYARHLGDLDLVGTASRYEGARLVKPITGPLNAAAMGGLPFDRDQLHYGVTWQLPLFAGGALVGGDRAARAAEQAYGHLSTRSQQEVWFAVRTTYRAALGLGHALAAAEAYEHALAQDEASARLKVETEAMSSADGAKVQFALASAHARRAALAAQQRTALAQLAALLGDDPGTAAYELSDLPEPPAERSAVLPTLTAGALGQRPDLSAAREGAEAQRLRGSVVRAGFWPQLVFTGSYLFNDAPSVGAPLRTWELGLAVKIPLLGDVGRVAAVREASAATAAAAERERAKAREVESQVVDAIGRLEASRAAFEAGTAQRRLGVEVARVEKLRFEAGTGRIEDYLTARAQELEGETGYWQGLYGLQAAHDNLDLATGQGGTHE